MMKSVIASSIVLAACVSNTAAPPASPENTPAPAPANSPPAPPASASAASAQTPANASSAPGASGPATSGPAAGGEIKPAPFQETNDPSDAPKEAKRSL